MNPYLTTDLHKGHLAMVLKPRSSSSQVVSKTLDQSKIDQIISRYYQGLPEVKAGEPMTINVKEVNDISLGYKGIKELKKDVHDNYANRSISKTGENAYYVS